MDCWVCKVDAITMIEGVEIGFVSTYTYPCFTNLEEVFEYEKRGTGVKHLDLYQSGIVSIRNVEIQTKTNCKRR